MTLNLRVLYLVGNQFDDHHHCRPRREHFMAPPSNPEANPAGWNNNTEENVEQRADSTSLHGSQGQVLIHYLELWKTGPTPTPSLT